MYRLPTPGRTLPVILGSCRPMWRKRYINCGVPKRFIKRSIKRLTDTHNDYSPKTLVSK